LRLLGLLALGDVALDAEVAGHHTSLVADRRDDQRIPEGRPVFAVIENLAFKVTVAP